MLKRHASDRAPGATSHWPLATSHWRGWQATSRRNRHQFHTNSAAHAEHPLRSDV